MNNITFTLKGNWTTRQVWIDGKELNPLASQKVCNHSPDGFNWGYGGSGPAQLALAVCLHIMPSQLALRVYHSFKWEVIARLPKEDFEREVSITIPKV